MSLRALILLGVSVLWTLGCGGWAAPEEAGKAGETESAAEPEAASGAAAESEPKAPAAPAVDPDLALARRLLETDSAVLFGGENVGDTRLLEDIKKDIAAVGFEGDPEGLELARTLFGENPLLSEKNPLVTDEDRQQWLAAAIRSVGRDKALEHLRGEAEKLASGEIDRAHWYEHVAACEKVCNKVVSGLLHAHVRRVRELPHRLVLFPTNQNDVTPEQLGEVDGLLAEVVRRGGGAQTEMLLIGRASRSGAKAYNRKLSERRVGAVAEALQGRGIGEERIHGFGLGYEPPQITEEIARAYGLDTSLTPEQRNQSVLVVAHFPETDGSSG